MHSVRLMAFSGQFIRTMTLKIHTRHPLSSLMATQRIVLDRLRQSHDLILADNLFHSLKTRLRTKSPRNKGTECFLISAGQKLQTVTEGKNKDQILNMMQVFVNLSDRILSFKVWGLCTQRATVFTLLICMHSVVQY